MRIEHALVTGGAGFIGSHLVDALLAGGARVRVLDNLLPQAHPGGVARWLSPAAELQIGDLRDRTAVERALAGVDVVFHLGGVVGNGQSMIEVHQYIDVNSSGTAQLLQGMLARRAQFRRLVLASSMVVYGDGAYRCPSCGPIPEALRPPARLQARLWEPICPHCGVEVHPVATSENQPLRPTSVYGISKRDQEELALCLGRAHGLPTIALRCLNVYGSRQALSNPYTGVAAIMASRLINLRSPTIFEDGQQRRDLVHVSDVVRANVAAAEAPDHVCGQPFNIGTGRSVTVIEIARLLAEGLNREHIAPNVTGEYRDGDIRHCFADVERARELLGWEARVSLADGAAELVTWAAGERPTDLTDRANAELRASGLIW